MTGCLAVGVAIAAIGPIASTAAAPAGKKIEPVHLANSCFALRSALTGRFVGPSGDTYRADQPTSASAAAFFWKPATLRTFLPHDQAGRMLTANADGRVGGTETAGPAAEWSVPHLGNQGVAAVAGRAPACRLTVG
jgi:hypothetical protein